MVGVDDGVADLELDALDFARDFEVFQQLLFNDVGDGVPPSGPGLANLVPARSAGSGRPG
jgi:hypothetical protein